MLALRRKIKNRFQKAYYSYYPRICDILLDKRIDRRILVIESDDWGSIRVPSKEVKEHLLAKGYKMDSRPFERCDTLESNTDLEELFNVLTKYKDIKGNHPVITANSLVCNPDFMKIKDSGFTKYYYEPCQKTYLSYPNSDRVEEIIKKGISLGVFYPQSHGREHFNYNTWLKLLQMNDPDMLTAFDYRMCGIFPLKKPDLGNSILVAFQHNNSEQKESIIMSVIDGLDLFEKRFGYKSSTFVAPCYCWCDEIEYILYNEGIRMIQTDRARRDSESNQIRYHFNGEKSKSRVVYSVRNCFFEPSISINSDEAHNCLRQIRLAFQNKKAAVISSHRINYVGGINPTNRDTTLKQLDWLLATVIKEFPDVEFISSKDLFEDVYNNA